MPLSPILHVLLPPTAIVLLTTLFLRLLHTIPSTNPIPPPPRSRTQPAHILIVLGSGGHTAEMLSSLSNLNPAHYSHRTYVTSTNDDFSVLKAQEFEAGLSSRRQIVASGGYKKGDGAADKQNTAKPLNETSRGEGWSIHTVPRARQIHQSLLTTPLSSVHCLLSCLRLLLAHPAGYPDLILTNGPATALILILASVLIRFFLFLPLGFLRGGGVEGYEGRRSGYEGGKTGGSGGKWGYEDRTGKYEGRRDGAMRVIYAESFARVRTPSLSCRIVVWAGLAHRVLVQWPELEERGWGEYAGCLVR